MEARGEGRRDRSGGILLAAVLTLAAAVVAGCLGAADEPLESTGAPGSIAAFGPLVTLVEDPAGDAYESSSDAARDSARLGVFFACAVANLADRDAGTACFDQARPEEIGSGAPRAGRPADPALDVRSLSFQASDTVVAVELELGRMDETLDWVGESTVIYQACWDSQPPWLFNTTFCDRGVHLIVEPTAAGSPVVRYAAYLHRGDECNVQWPFRGCILPVSYTLIPGSPGRIRWEIPRDRIQNATVLERPFAITQQDTHLYGDNAGIDFNTPPPFTYEPCPCYLDGTNLVSGVDDTSFGEAFPLPPAALVDSRVATGARTVDPAGDLVFGASPEVDILSTTLLETAENLTIAVEFATVEDPPRGIVVWGQLGLPGRSVQAGVRYHGEEEMRRAELCSGMRQGWCSHSSDIAFDVTTATGSPGWVNLTFARAALGFPLAGETVHSVLSLAYTVRRTAELPKTSPVPFYVQEMPALDIGPLAPAARLGLGEPPRTVEGVPVSVSVEDETYDAGGVCFGVDCRRLDILSLEAAAAGPTELMITLGIRDLSQVRVPPGYQSLVYAAALRTGEGQAMFGYHRSESSPGTFFCAQDTLVLVASPLDPTGVVWTNIQGIVSQSAAGQGVSQAQGSAGAITLHVPHECFGKKSPGPLHVEQLGAGTFLVRNPANRPGDGQVEEADRVQRDEPFTIASVVPPAPPGDPWYARDLFWNIFGAFLAVVTVLATIGVFYRRRRLMRWYLDELTRIEQTYVEDAILRGKAILALRKRLHQDIVRHRVSDSEYIRDRIRSGLTSARLVSLSEDYYDLPAQLALRLERLLDDGRMTKEEGRLIEQVMRRSRLPEEARDVLVERVRTWVEEDAGWA